MEIISTGQQDPAALYPATMRAMDSGSSTQRRAREPNPVIAPASNEKDVPTLVVKEPRGSAWLEKKRPAAPSDHDLFSVKKREGSISHPMSTTLTGHDLFMSNTSAGHDLFGVNKGERTIPQPMSNMPTGHDLFGVQKREDTVPSKVTTSGQDLFGIKTRDGSVPSKTLSGQDLFCVKKPDGTSPPRTTSGHDLFGIQKRDGTIPPPMSNNPWAAALLGKTSTVAQPRNIYEQHGNPFTARPSSSVNDARGVLTPDSAQSHPSSDRFSTTAPRHIPFAAPNATTPVQSNTPPRPSATSPPYSLFAPSPNPQHPAQSTAPVSYTATDGYIPPPAPSTTSPPSTTTPWFPAPPPPPYNPFVHASTPANSAQLFQTASQHSQPQQHLQLPQPHQHTQHSQYAQPHQTSQSAQFPQPPPPPGPPPPPQYPPPPQSSQPSQPTQAYSVLDNGSQNRPHRAHTTNLFDDVEDEKYTSGGDQLFTKRQTGRPRREPRTFACPYHRQYPGEEMLDKRCYNPAADVHKVKAHILEIHSPMKRCQRCKKLFGTEVELDGHVQHNTCDWQEKRHLSNATAMVELFQRSNSELPEEAIWVNMFKVLLPHVADSDIPTPYWEKHQPVRPFHEFRQFLNLPDSMDHNAEDLYRRYLKSFDMQAPSATGSRPRTSPPIVSSPSSSHPVQTQAPPILSPRMHIPEAASVTHVAAMSSQTHPVPKTTSKSASPQGSSKVTLSTTASTFSTLITTRKRGAPSSPSASDSQQQFDAGFAPFTPHTFFQQRSFTQSRPVNPAYVNGPSTQYTVSQRDQTISVVMPGNKTSTYAHSSTFTGTKSKSGSVPRLREGDLRGRKPLLS